MRLWIVGLSLILLVACAQGDSGSTAPAAEDGSELVGAVEGVCAARDAAGRSPEDAALLFLDRSHDGTHRLADEVASVDRGTAAAVLEAKQSVEAVADGSDARALQDALDGLGRAGGDALAALGIEEPACVTPGRP